MAIVAMNIWMKMITPVDTALARIDLLSSPFSVTKHMQLGKELYGMGNTKEAERELAIADQFSSVLGAQSPPATLQKTWDAEAHRLTTLYSYWLHVVETKPDYRDAYVTLASLAQALNKPTEAQGFFHQAQMLDPNLKIEY
jgi:hypothetical protein